MRQEEFEIDRIREVDIDTQRQAESDWSSWMRRHMDLPISTRQAVSSENSDDVEGWGMGEDCNGYNNGRGERGKEEGLSGSTGR